jgi:RNA:NAD 2'-phosphotransferase (TPT1/KptA family)
MSSDGFVLLDDILHKQQFNGVNVEDVKDVVTTCPKQRFKLEEKTNPKTNEPALYIHTINDTPFN